MFSTLLRSAYFIRRVDEYPRHDVKAVKLQTGTAALFARALAAIIRRATAQYTPISDCAASMLRGTAMHCCAQHVTVFAPSYAPPTSPLPTRLIYLLAIRVCRTTCVSLADLHAAGRILR